MRLAVLTALLAGNPEEAVAGTPESLDDRQREIVRVVTDEVIDEIGKLKAKHPELEKFGEAPFFTRRGEGEFRYDYKVEKVKPKDGGPPVRARTGGCGIYFRLASVGTPWSGIHGMSSMGGARAGIAHELGIVAHRPGGDEGPAPPIVGEIMAAMQRVLDTTFERLAAEYWLEKRGIATDTQALLAAVEVRDPEVSENALRALRFRNLTAEDLGSLRTSIRGGQCPTEALYEAMRVVKAQDAAHLAEFYEDVIALTIAMERQGNETFVRTPFFGSGAEGQARAIRETVSREIRMSREPRFLAAARRLLADDPVTAHRLNALEYVGTLDGERASDVVAEALENPHRSVQARASELAGEKRIESAIPALEQLAASHSPTVRKRAAAALQRLGHPVKEFSAPPLGDTAREIASALWDRGLTEEDIIDTCSQPDTAAYFGRIAAPSAPLPPGVRVDEQNVRRLTDPWRMKAVDKDSVRKRAAQYAAGIGCSPFHTGIHATGPFLLAASLKLRDEKTAATVYGRMCEEFETDAAALERGVTAIAWNRFLAGLDHFQRKRDQAALTALAAVAGFQDLATPHTVLDTCVRQSAGLIPEIEARLARKAPAEPAPEDRPAWIGYWVGQIAEINGIMPGQPASPCIWYDEIKSSDIPQPPFASDKLREAGLPALPALIEVIDDRTPTRTVGYWRDFHPARHLVTVGGAAREIIAVICVDHGIQPPKALRDAKGSADPVRAELREWAATVPRDARRLSKTERRKFVEENFPSGPFVDAP